MEWVSTTERANETVEGITKSTGIVARSLPPKATERTSKLKGKGKGSSDKPEPQEEDQGLHH